MARKLVERKNVPQEQTWNLKDLYATEEDLFSDLEKMKDLAKELEEEYKGRLDSPERIAECLKKYQELKKTETLLGNYCELAVSVDFRDSHNQELSGRVNREIANVSAKLSFIDSELGQQSEEILRKAAELDRGNAGYIRNILSFKPHQLSPEAEKTLAALSRTLEVPYEIYNITKFGDMRFRDFKAGGKKYPLGYSLFEDDYEYEPDTEVRRAAFKAFSDKLKEYRNVTAAAYNAQLQKEKTLAEMRGYKNVFDSLLQSQRVSRELYDRQIDLIMEKLAPHMRRYARLLQKIHGLDKMTYADLKLPVDPGYAPQVSIREAREYIEKGLSVMGKDYGKMIGEAFEDRWVDFAQNDGKSTGGFCASPYGSHSYILLNWNEKMSDVFTLAHELGHAGHFKACSEAQTIFDTEVSLYFVEAPSTMNEILLGHHLLKTRKDRRFRRWVFANMIGNTYYHNFVTHLLEAAYQREVYQKVDQGEILQAQTLDAIMKETLSRFWGNDVELTPGAELTWMRQPHYYSGLYSYTYSAGLTIATQAAKRIEEKGKSAVEDWMKALRAGGTLPPTELAALAKVDITTEEPLLNTISTIGDMIDEICKLTRELEKI